MHLVQCWISTSQTIGCIPRILNRHRKRTMTSQQWCFQEHPVESMSWKTWSILGLEVTWCDFQNSLCHIWPYVWCVTRAEVHLLFRHGSVPLERDDLLHASSVIQALHGGSKSAPSSHRTDMCLSDLHCLFWVDHPKHWMFGPGNLGKILWWLP